MSYFSFIYLLSSWIDREECTLSSRGLHVSGVVHSVPSPPFKSYNWNQSPRLSLSLCQSLVPHFPSSRMDPLHWFSARALPSLSHHHHHCHHYYHVTGHRNLIVAIFIMIMAHTESRQKGSAGRCSCWPCTGALASARFQSNPPFSRWVGHFFFFLFNRWIFSYGRSPADTQNTRKCPYHHRHCYLVKQYRNDAICRFRLSRLTDVFVTHQKIKSTKGERQNEMTVAQHIERKWNKKASADFSAIVSLIRPTPLRFAW